MRLTRVTNRASVHSGARGCRLRVLGGDEPALEVTLPAVGVVIGADQGADVVLADDSVSSKHCTVVPADDGFKVTDLDSSNGTFVDGVRLTSALVPFGATLRLGRSLIQLMPAEEAAEIPPSVASSFGELLGSSAAMRLVYAMLERASPTEASVLLSGESGTGKELAARSIHRGSSRRDGPFVVFDCGAASENLTDSALFGHSKGAFTGAVSDRRGAFANAHGGTLFLDEIGDLPLALQPKLLRLLEAGEVTPLGKETAERYDVRVIAASHRDLYSDVSAGTFRGDLYYRLAVVEVELPPLRARLADLPVLVSTFLGLTEEAALTTAAALANLERLHRYSWPGNVRELRNVIGRAKALAPEGAPFGEMPILLRKGGQTNAPSTPSFTADRPFHQVKAEVLAQFERAYLEDLLSRSAGNISAAARMAGVERKHLYKLLERAGLR